MVPDTTVGAIADQLSSGDAALTNPTARDLRADTTVPVVAYACPVRPRHTFVDFTVYDTATVLIAHDPALTAEFAAGVVAIALKRPVALAEAVTL